MHLCGKEDSANWGDYIDIADWLVRYMFGPPPEEVDKWHLEFLKAAEFISPEYHVEVEAMIHDLELGFWGAIKLDPPPEEASTDTESEKKPNKMMQLAP